MEQHGGADAHRRACHGGEQRLFEGGDAAVIRIELFPLVDVCG
jgi:hypothetical protein